MATIDVKTRVFVDWDGDGFINKGAVIGGSLNLVASPITLNDMVKNTIASRANGFPSGTWSKPNIDPQYDPTDRGLFSWTGTAILNDSIYVGWRSSNIADTPHHPFSKTTLPAGTYTVAFYVKGVSNFASTVFTIQFGQADNTGIFFTSITQPSTTFTPTGSYTLVLHTFTTSAPIQYNTLQIKHTSTAATTVLAITGFALYSGTYTLTTLPAFNVGNVLSTYDNIASFVEAINWQLGMGSPKDVIASEGTAQITLRNTLNTFSMENSNSFLYGAAVPAGVNGYPYTFPSVQFQEGVVISIEVFNVQTSTWIEVWRGFVDNIDVDTGVVGSVATLQASQGLFKFDSNRLDTEVLQGLTGDQIIKKAIDSGWITAVVPNTFAQNVTKLDDTNKYAVLTSANSYLLDVGQQTYDFSGESWTSGNTSPVDVVREVMNVEQGLFFINRNGVIRFMHRDRIYSNKTSEPAEIVLTDNQVQVSNYQSSQGSINSIKVDYGPKQQLTGQIWASKSPFTLTPKQVLQTSVKLENLENTKLTAIIVNKFNDLTLPSTYTVTDSAGNALSATMAWVVPLLKNGQITLTIYNYSGKDVKVSVVLNGTYIVSYGSVSVYRNYQRYQPTVGAKQQSVQTKLLTTDRQASALGDFIVADNAKRYSTFDNLTVASRDAVWLDRALNLTIGKRVNFKETNVGNVNHRMIIVGESGQWTPGILTMNYTLRPADTIPALILNATQPGAEGLLY